MKFNLLNNSNKFSILYNNSYFPIYPLFQEHIYQNEIESRFYYDKNNFLAYHNYKPDRFHLNNKSYLNSSKHSQTNINVTYFDEKIVPTSLNKREYIQKNSLKKSTFENKNRNLPMRLIFNFQEINDFSPKEKEIIMQKEIKISFDKFKKISKPVKLKLQKIIDLTMKFISNKTIYLKDLEGFEKKDLIIFLFYLIKRNLITHSCANNLIGFQKFNWNNLVHFLNNCKKSSNMNESSFKETIINRVLRKCFNEWLQSNYKTLVSISDNFEINKCFWKYMCNEAGIIDFETIYEDIKKNYQILKKNLVEKRKNIYFNQTKKFFNILINKNLFKTITLIIKDNLNFKKFYIEYKNSVLNKYLNYSDDTIDQDNISIDFDRNPKYTVKLESQLKKFFLSIQKEFKITNEFVFLLKKNKYLKKFSSPITLSDYIKIFKKIQHSINI